MFKQPRRLDPNQAEGTVIEVDPERMLCKVKTSLGQNLNSVQWLSSTGGSSRGGDRGTPVMGDRVAINFGLGFPLIQGYLPCLDSTADSFPISIDSGAQIVNTGNFGTENSLATADANKPRDMLAGDRILSSVGGAILGLLRGGSILLRSSRLAEIFISKYDDLVRIVSRNFLHFSDAHTDSIRSEGGTAYRYIGYANNVQAGKSESYQYEQHYGSVAASEAGKGNPSAKGGSGSAIFKENVGGNMSRTLDLSGASETIVINTRHLQDKDVIILTYGENQTITIDSNQIKHDVGGVSVVTITPDSILTEHGDAKTLHNASGVYHDFGGHFVHVTAGGVQMG